MIKEKKLKIVHCNIDSCANKGNADMILNEVLKHNADIIIFTEYTNALIQYFRDILIKKYPQIYIVCDPPSNCNGIEMKYNGIAMFISSEYKEAEKIDIKWRGGIHPEIICAKIKGNNIETSIAGVRFKLLDQGNIAEIINFLSFVDDYEPDIFIGDFNWCSVFQDRKYLLKTIESMNGKIFDENYQDVQEKVSNLNILVEKRGKLQYKHDDNLEQKLCDILNGLVKNKKRNFSMWPTDKLDNWSFIKKIKGGETFGVTSPDRIVYDSNIIDECKAEYYPHVDKETEFPREWGTDHAMIITTLTFK